MKHIFIPVLTFLTIMSSTTNSIQAGNQIHDNKPIISLSSNTIKVSDIDQLRNAIKMAKPGDNIIMTNGVWKDVKLKFTSKGTKEKPITLSAETAGKVFIEGESYLKIGGEYLIVDGLYFRNGYTTSNAVIDFKKDKETVANHCRVTNCVIEDYNQPQRDRKDHWVEFWGRYNQLDHCYITGKSNEGPTIRVEIKGNRNIQNYHQIIHNHFGPRPRKGGPKAETIQLGDSFSSMSPSNTTVAHNLFEECNGEVEVISSKTNFNIFKNNVFYKSEGSLVTRHGNYCQIEGNFFIGDGVNKNYGGIRIINTGHSVTNNYFYNMIGENFRSPLAVMNGIPKSPLNRYNQVTDVTIAYNTWVDCKSPLQFGVGTNISQADVLPKAEIRSAVPIRTEVANNIIFNKKGDALPYVAHDKIDNITFRNNKVENQGVVFEKLNGLEHTDMNVTEINDYLKLPIIEGNNKVYNGFGYEKIQQDIFGNTRSTKHNKIGAVTNIPERDPNLLEYSKYGPKWFKLDKEVSTPKELSAIDAETLYKAVTEANSGDIIQLGPEVIQLEKSLQIDKELIIKGGTIEFKGTATTPLFEMNPKGNLTLEKTKISGNRKNYAFATLAQNMSSLYNLNIINCDVSNFDYVLKAYKESFADNINFKSTKIHKCANGLELSEETNDKGDYNVEFLTITDCDFEDISSNVIDYYRGGYDESTIGGNLLIENSNFKNCGAEEENNILLNHRGIVNVTLNHNTFIDNNVELISVLWGAKNNSESNNSINNSGKIITQENLKLKIVY